MLTIIVPSQFKILPWKNGKGETTELAINHQGTLDDFDWRLSIASVVEDGMFSDFSSYERNLVLIKGQGITLQHDEQTTDHLSALLSFATFDGGCKTQGTLLNGVIKDFNIITRQKLYRTQVNTYQTKQEVLIAPCKFCFVYSLTSNVLISSTTKTQNLEQGHLLQGSDLDDDLSVVGESMIIVQLRLRA